MAMEHSKLLVHNFVPPGGQQTQAIVAPLVVYVAHVWAFDLVEPSPPDLPILHSTFLI
jgi:hypothetical protein